MTLAPLLNASPVIQIHTILALLAVVLTIAVLCLRKGTTLHKMLGRFWVAAMAVVALSSFFIHELRLVGPFSPIHILSVLTLFSLVRAIHAARIGDIKTHQRTMKSLIFGALLVAGAFTFFPGRVMYMVVTGG